MADRFDEIGKIAAIEELYAIDAARPFAARSGGWFQSEGKSYTSTRSRLFLEGIDFDLVYFPLKHLGHKCVTAVTGELYAELAHPRLLSVRLGVSSKLGFSHVRDLWEGIVTAAREYGYADVDVDLAPSQNGLAVSVAATGETALLTGKRRPAAHSKDIVCVSGSLGAAYLGLRLLEEGKRAFDAGGVQPDLERYRMLVGAYLKPELGPGTVSRLEAEEIYPSYGSLVTRGLADAVKRLVRDTGLGCKVYADRIPFEGNTFELGRTLDIDPVSAAMNGGDDCRLLFVIPILAAERFRREFQTFDIIGHLARPEVGAVLVTLDGIELPLRAQGWPDSESI